MCACSYVLERVGKTCVMTNFSLPPCNSGSYIQYTLLFALLRLLSLRAFLIFSETSIILMIILGLLWYDYQIVPCVCTRQLMAVFICSCSCLLFFLLQTAKILRPVTLSLILCASHARTFSLINGYAGPLEVYKILEHHDDAGKGEKMHVAGVDCV